MAKKRNKPGPTDKSRASRPLISFTAKESRMKRYSNIYPKIYDFESLLIAYNNAKKLKRFRNEVLRFTDHLEENLIIIQNELIWKSYEQSQYREFFVNEPKKRLIMALPFRDRVVQWSIYQNLFPMLERKYISDSFACRKGKGAYQALQWLWNSLGSIPDSRSWYYLKLDIHKYFYRVSHSILLSIYEKHFPDKDLLWLLEKIITANDGNLGLVDGSVDYETRTCGVGMAVGNLVSQMSANVYLNELDQFAKRDLGIRHYARYMDDVLCLSPNKRELHEWRLTMQEFVETRLALRTNSKTQVRPVSQGIDWVGYRTWPSMIRLRKSSAKRLKRRLKSLRRMFIEGSITFRDFDNSFQSYMGMMKHCTDDALKESVCEMIGGKL
jgi:retron-type reverse transcriptase